MQNFFANPLPMVFPVSCRGLGFVYLENTEWDCFSKAWLFAPVPLDLLVAVQRAGRVYVRASAQLT